MPDLRTTNLDSLRSLTADVLDAQRPLWSLRHEVVEIIKILAASGMIPADSKTGMSHGESRTEHGLAISPRMAAMCAEDFARTAAFIRGTHAAIMEIRSQHADRPARVLYAGCGPYATLAAPLMAVLSPDEARFTLVDLHADSIASVRSIIAALGLTGHIAHCEAMDAFSYQVNPQFVPDVILLEVMRAGLELEPQVAAARHLVPQAPDAILLPEEVRIDLMLVDVSCEFDLKGAAKDGGDVQRDRIPLATVFVVNRESIHSWKGIGGDRLPGFAARFPDPVERRYVPMLFTIVRVFRDHILKDYDSGLTAPRVFSSPTPIGPGQAIQFHYELGRHPRLGTEARADP